MADSFAPEAHEDALVRMSPGDIPPDDRCRHLRWIALAVKRLRQRPAFLAVENIDRERHPNRNRLFAAVVVTIPVRPSISSRIIQSSVVSSSGVLARKRLPFSRRPTTMPKRLPLRSVTTV